MRIVIPPSHRYQAIHGREQWGVQRTQQIKQYFYWPGWRRDTVLFITECAGCLLHREKIDLKNVGCTTYQNREINFMH